MKRLIQWLCDPSVHLLIVALFVFQPAMTAGLDWEGAEEASPKICKDCHIEHYEWEGCSLAVEDTLASLLPE